MKTAYLYVRVSTDEQKRKGYSLPEQEDRLRKYCDCNDIEIKGIFREDHSAKNFNRPEWKKLIAAIKAEKHKHDNNVLFIKWDRFSRNIEYAYEMIGILRKYGATAMAIDQPIDFTIPESTVMLAVYLSIPEAENGRRGLNTANGIRRAKQMGRYPNKAPVGYINLAGLDGRKYIAPQQSEADIMKWAFYQLAKNTCRVEDVRKMVCANELNKFVPKREIADLYKTVIKDIFYQQTGSQTDGRKELLNQIQAETDHLAKARKLLLDDAIDTNDYKLIKSECETKLLSLEAKLTGFSEKSYDLSDCIDKAITNLTRLQIAYSEGDTTAKRSIIGSIYPEKLCFDGMTYRTAKINEAAQLIYLINSQLGSKKKSDKT